MRLVVATPQRTFASTNISNQKTKNNNHEKAQHHRNTDSQRRRTKAELSACIYLLSCDKLGLRTERPLHHKHLKPKTTTMKKLTSTETASINAGGMKQN